MRNPASRSSPGSTFEDCAQPCPMCGSREQPIYVHGHSQCATCKVNIDPCCGGAPLDGAEAA